MNGNPIQQNIAANPTGAASRRRERLATLDGGQRKREVGDEKDRADSPCVEVVVQDEEIGGSVFDDGAFHFGAGSVNNSGTHGFDWLLSWKGDLQAGQK
jgi:hypothetical protein